MHAEPGQMQQHNPGHQQAQETESDFSFGESEFSEGTGFEDNRPEKLQQQNRQARINQSPRVQQLKAIQALANASLQVKETSQLQADGDSYAAAIHPFTQLRRTDEHSGVRQLKTETGGGGDKGVIQRVSTQITTDDAQGIDQVIVRGRPPRVFSGSMGDHTTAFIVQTEGINIALHGKTLEEAIAYMQTLEGDLQALPGTQLLQIDTPDALKDNRVKRLFMHELARLHASRLDAQNAWGDGKKGDFNRTVSHLQDAIDAYLCARELVPLSTVNVAAISPGLAGKGHGESAPAAVLSTYERNPKCGIPVRELVDAVHDLFDTQSAGFLASEVRADMVSEMTAGIHFPGKTNQKARMTMIWNQHLQTIQRMFPKVYKAVAKSLKKKRIFSDLERINRKTLIDHLKEVTNRLNQLDRQRQQYSLGSGDKKSPYRGDNLNMTRLRSITKMYELAREIRDHFPALDALDATLDNDYATNIALLENRLETIGNDIDNAVAKYDADRDLATIKEEYKKQGNAHKAGKNNTAQKNLQVLRSFQDGNPLSDFIARMIPEDEAMDLMDLQDASESETDSEDSDMAVATSTLTRGHQSMAIQVQLDRTTGLVSGLTSAGRPPSPFKDTMGAHTTAWVVHLDRIRARISGKTVPAAVTEMNRLLKEVKAMIKKLITDKKSPQWGNNARHQFDFLEGNMLRYEDCKPKSFDLADLQMMISSILTVYNLIPGVSKKKSDTSGKGEGTYRQTLMHYEHYGHGTQSQLVAAMAGLYDGGHNSPMYDYHYKFMEQAYPKAYRYAITGKSTVKRIDIPNDDPYASTGDTEPDILPLTKEQTLALTAQSKNSSWLVHRNNCLINAVTAAAHLPDATGADVVNIRQQLGAPLGTMLYADQRNLDILANHFGITARGIIVVYEGGVWTDQTSIVGPDPIFIYHDGVNHFTALYEQVDPNASSGKDEDKKASKRMRVATTDGTKKGVNTKDADKPEDRSHD